MKIEEYTRELIGEGYTVIGSAVYGKDNFVDFGRYAPITMSLSSGPLHHPMPNGRPIYDNLDDIISIARPEIPYDDEITGGFEKNYAEVMRGNRPDWQLGGFSVSAGCILLGFGHPESGDAAFLDISGAQNLWLTFRTSRTRLGFDPVYNVHIKHSGKNHLLTKIEEDLGYVYREIEFKEKGHNAPGGDRQYIEIIEYTAM